MDLSKHSLTQLKQAAEHVAKMQGIVEQDQAKFPEGDFNLVRGLLDETQSEIRAEAERKAGAATE